MRLEISLAIGYQRRRAGMVDRWEARLTTLGLFIVGALVTLFVVIVIVPRVLGGL